MKALSVNPPYGSLIVVAARYPELGKGIETRGWSTDYRGPLAIHQTAGLGAMFASEAELWDLCLSEPFRTALAAIGLMNPAQLPRGKIVAITELADCRPTGASIRAYGVHMPDGDRIWELTDQERAFGNYAPGRFAWLLANIRALPEPIPARGMPGLFDWQPPTGLVLP